MVIPLQVCLVTEHKQSFKKAYSVPPSPFSQVLQIIHYVGKFDRSLQMLKIDTILMEVHQHLLINFRHSFIL